MCKELAQGAFHLSDRVISFLSNDWVGVALFCGLAFGTSRGLGRNVSSDGVRSLGETTDRPDSHGARIGGKSRCMDYVDWPRGDCNRRWTSDTQSCPLGRCHRRPDALLPISRKRESRTRASDDPAEARSLCWAPSNDSACVHRGTHRQRLAAEVIEHRVPAPVIYETAYEDEQEKSEAIASRLNG